MNQIDDLHKQREYEVKRIDKNIFDNNQNNSNMSLNNTNKEDLVYNSSNMRESNEYREKPHIEIEQNQILCIEDHSKNYDTNADNYQTFSKDSHNYQTFSKDSHNYQTFSKDSHKPRELDHDIEMVKNLK